MEKLTAKFDKEVALTTFLNELLFLSSPEIGLFQVQYLRHIGEKIIRDIIDQPERCLEKQ